MTTKHTPTPWHFEGDRIWQCGDNIEPIAYVDTYPNEVERLANAAYIVRAVNSHEVLVEALEDAIKQIKSSKEFNAPIKQSFHVKNLVENKLKKALAAAKE